MNFGLGGDRYFSFANMEGCHDTFHKIGLHSPIDHLDIPSSLFDDLEDMMILSFAHFKMYAIHS